MMTDNGAGISINTGGTAPDASALLDMSSTTKGVLVPRMTTAEREAIVSPSKGLLVFDNSSSTFWFYNGLAWLELTGTGSSGNWTVLGNNIYNNNSGNVGIGTSTPDFKLTVNGDAMINTGLGIATASPDLFTYKLDVNGSARTRTDHYINRDLWVDRNLDVDGTSNLFGNITAGSNLTVDDNVTVGGNLSVTGQVTTDAGKGIVRSNNGTQQVVVYPSGSVGYTNAPAGYTDDVEFVLPNVFSGNPRVSLAQVTGQSGTFERWTYTIHSIDIVTHRFTVRFYNASSSSSTFTATFNFIAMGPAL